MPTLQKAFTQNVLTLSYLLEINIEWVTKACSILAWSKIYYHKKNCVTKVVKQSQIPNLKIYAKAIIDSKKFCWKTPAMSVPISLFYKFINID